MSSKVGLFVRQSFLHFPGKCLCAEENPFLNSFPFFCRDYHCLLSPPLTHSLTLSRQAQRSKGDFAPVRKGARGAGRVTYGEFMEGGDSLCVHYSSINDLRKSPPTQALDGSIF